MIDLKIIKPCTPFGQVSPSAARQLFELEPKEKTDEILFVSVANDSLNVMGDQHRIMAKSILCACDGSAQALEACHHCTERGGLLSELSDRRARMLRIAKLACASEGGQKLLNPGGD